MNPPADGLYEVRIRGELRDDFVVGIVGIDPKSLRLAFQSRAAIAVGSAVWPWAIAATRIDHDSRRFGPNVKLVTVPQASNADTRVDANALDLPGHRSAPTNCCY